MIRIHGSIQIPTTQVSQIKGLAVGPFRRSPSRYQIIKSVGQKNIYTHSRILCMEGSQQIGSSLTYGSSLFPTLAIGIGISICQFFNMRANFCLTIWGGRCEYPPEYAYPFILLCLLFVLSVLYGIWWLTRRQWRYGMGAISGGFFSLALFFLVGFFGAMSTKIF